MVRAGLTEKQVEWRRFCLFGSFSQSLFSFSAFLLSYVESFSHFSSCNHLEPVNINELVLLSVSKLCAQSWDWCGNPRANYVLISSLGRISVRERFGRACLCARVANNGENIWEEAENRQESRRGEEN